MSADGTPGWAYDEDGYCVSCGNGKWKAHMPVCELRDALDERVLADDLAEVLQLVNYVEPDVEAEMQRVLARWREARR